MIIRLPKFMFVGCMVLLSSCARMPDASINYYLPKTKANVTVYQTVSCIDITTPIVATTVNIKPLYSANIEKIKTLNFSKLDTFYSSGSADITLTKDGRLESFNSSSTGVGNEVINTIVSILGVATIKGVVDVQAACEAINRVAGEEDEKPLPLSVVLKSIVTFNNDKTITTTSFRITNYPQSFYNEIEPALGILSYDKLDASKVIVNPLPVNNNAKGSTVTLVESAIVPVKITKTSFCSAGTTEQTKYEGSIPVPQWGTEYDIPIPKPPLFGSNNLELSLHDDGKVKRLKYGSTSGAKDFGKAFDTLKNQFTKTDSEKAAELEAEADIIKQQQRLIKCQTVPSECK